MVFQLLRQYDLYYQKSLHLQKLCLCIYLFQNFISVPLGRLGSPRWGQISSDRMTRIKILSLVNCSGRWVFFNCLFKDKIDCIHFSPWFGFIEDPTLELVVPKQLIVRFLHSPIIICNIHQWIRRMKNQHSTYNRDQPTTKFWFVRFRPRRSVDPWPGDARRILVKASAIPSNIERFSLFA